MDKIKYKLIYMSGLLIKLESVCLNIKGVIDRGGAEITIDDVNLVEDFLSRIEKLRDNVREQEELKDKESMRYGEN